jgi:hypothetical protein
MIRNSLTGIWGQIKVRMTSRLCARTDDGAGNNVRYDKIDVLASVEGRSDTQYLEDEHDAVAKRAAFSQHISS